MAPTVDFPVRLLRQHRLTMHRIACAALPCGRSGKPISAPPYDQERLLAEYHQQYDADGDQSDAAEFLRCGAFLEEPI